MTWYRISFVVGTEDEAKLFVEDATKEAEKPDQGLISWNDIDGNIHEWDVNDVKYEKVES